MLYKPKTSKYWWFKRDWQGECIRKSTKVANKRAAQSIEDAFFTALAKGEVGIIEKKPAPTLAQFIDREFLPFLERTSPTKLTFYSSRTENLKSYSRLAATPLDRIDHDLIQQFIDFRKDHRFEFRTGKEGGRKERSDGKPLAVSTVNRDLATLRRIFKLAIEWKRISAEPKVRLLPGENRRERALTEPEGTAYLDGAAKVAADKEATYQEALTGIRARARGQQPRKPDGFRLRDIAIIMLDAGLRPSECYELRAENLRDPGAIWVFSGKTPAARRRIPIMDQRLKAVLQMRLAQVGEDGWLFPNPDTESGHIEESSLSGDHEKALTASHVRPFDIYVLRHTCLTKWGEYMDAPRLKKYAGHEDFKTTLRYIHPRDESMEEAMEKANAAREVRLAKGGHNSRHTGETDKVQPEADLPAIN